jgi:hypothetical protein
VAASFAVMFMKMNILFLIGFLFLKPVASYGLMCDWSQAKKGKVFQSDVEVMTQSHQGVSEKVQKGQLIVAKENIFILRVKSGLQKHTYHGDGKYLRYYHKSATASGFTRKGDAQDLKTVWLGYLNQLIWGQGGKSEVQLKEKSHALKNGDCLTSWDIKDTQGVQPPFSKLSLTWIPGKEPQIQSFKLIEIRGQKTQISFSDFQWNTPIPVESLKSHEFALRNNIN